MSTQNDVARRAGVSFITVSRVINNKGNVKETTRQRVQEAIDELKYYPNSLGRGLNMNKVRTIGIVVPRNIGITINETAYYTQLMIGIEQACEKASYDILISSYRNSREKFDYVRLFYERKADGLLIIVPDLEHKHMRQIEEERIPAVIVGERPLSGHLSFVDSDNRQGMKKATEHMISLGHKQISFVKGEALNRNANDRFNGFEDAMKAAGLTVNQAWIFDGDFGPGSGRKALNQLLKMKDQPSGVLFANDQMAIGFLSEAEKMKVSIPGHFSVIGFDGIDAGGYTNPPLTTMRQPMVEMGHEAAEMLLRLIASEDTEPPLETKIFPVELVPGASVRKL